MLAPVVGFLWKGDSVPWTDDMFEVFGESRRMGRMAREIYVELVLSDVWIFQIKLWPN